jgi:adenine C2-methylase RlmN of 23S rRNA A2503 and tRNA A37
MPKKRILSPPSIWDVELVSEAFRSAGIKDMHIKRLYCRLAKDPYVDLDDIDGFPTEAKRLLDCDFVRMTSTCKSVKRSADGETTKLLIELQDGKSIEAVIMMYDTTKHGEGADEGKRGQAHQLEDRAENRDEAGDASSEPSTSSRGATGGKRYTLCVSSEVGCQMGCTFCATGTMGLQADLTSAEIVEQLVHARLRATPPRNIVFMGMGEPMNNYEQVRRAISLMIDGTVFALRRQCVTLSTVGVIPRIKQMASDLPGVSLALSLHAPTQELRQKIVPSARAYKLDRLIEAIDYYQEKTKQKVFVEYVLLGPDFNCTSDHAHQLGQLLRGKHVVVNVIPWNPILSPGFPYEAPPAGEIDEFLRILCIEYGLLATVRQEKGQDVGAACGQLVISSGGGGVERENGDGGKEIEDLV